MRRTNGGLHPRIVITVPSSSSATSRIIVGIIAHHPRRRSGLLRLPS